MARFQTRDEIQELIRVQYDLETLSASTNPTATNVVSMINESLQQLYAMLMECYGDDYFTESYTLATTASVATSSLPPDFVKLKSMSWRKDASTAVPLHVASVRELSMATLEPREWIAPKYRLSGSGIHWTPVPLSSYTVDLWYVAIPSDLSSGSDVVNVGPGWVQWVVHDVCTKIATRLRDQAMVSMFSQLRADAEKRLREQAPERNETEALGVRRVITAGRTLSREDGDGDDLDPYRGT